MTNFDQGNVLLLFKPLSLKDQQQMASLFNTSYKLSILLQKGLPSHIKLTFEFSRNHFLLQFYKPYSMLLPICAIMVILEQFDSFWAILKILLQFVFGEHP